MNVCFSEARVRLKAGSVSAGHPPLKCARTELAVCVCGQNVCVYVCVEGPGSSLWFHVPPFGSTTTTTAAEQCVLISRAHTT